MLEFGSDRGPLRSREFQGTACIYRVLGHGQAVGRMCDGSASPITCVFRSSLCISKQDLALLQPCGALHHGSSGPADVQEIPYMECFICNRKSLR